MGKLSRLGFPPVAPDLVVEVVSPGSTAAEIQRKTQDYLKAGVRLVMVAYPDTKSIVVHIRDGAKTLESRRDLRRRQGAAGLCAARGRSFPLSAADQKSPPTRHMIGRPGSDSK